MICHVTIIDQLVAGLRKKKSNNIFLIHIEYFEHLTFGMTVHCASIKIMRENIILNAQI